ncbi:MAG TPA: nucleotidyltransferase family protein [Xanthobacteraceae bacterium]|jgi:hypothetical protein|nr:nucleotidyltransferase family protein [Xanthobacteraceae bacterium]
MSLATLKQRLTRELGTIWPNDEQQLVLEAIFATPAKAREAYFAWRSTLDIEQPFDGAVMRLLPLLYMRLLKMGLSDPLTGRLKGVYRRAWSDTQTLFHGTAPALSALHGAGIDTMLLKGAGLVVCHYRNLGARPMSDVDIAVPFGSVEAAVRALSLAGWSSTAPITRDHLRFRHATPFRGPGGHEIDLHWHMMFTNCSAEADAPFWSTAQPATFRDMPTNVPAPALALLHTLEHGTQPNTETPIRWIADSLTLLRDPRAAMEWPLFCRTARLLGLSRRVLLALTYLRECHDQEIDAGVLKTLASAPRTIAERLELAVTARRVRRHRPAAIDRCLLIGAEFCRLARLRTGIRVTTMIPDFVRYRLGIVSWRGAIRNRLWRMKQGLRQAIG